MSFLWKITNKLLCWGIAPLFATLTLIQPADAQRNRAECLEYAETAVDHHRQNIRQRCGFEGARWSDARDTHFAWCLISPRKAQAETAAREKQLQECGQRRADRREDREGKRAACDTYAKIAVVQAEANREYRCGYRGGEWLADERQHRRWCMRNKRDFARDEIRYRMEELQECFNKLGDYDSDDYDRDYRRRRFRN